MNTPASRSSSVIRMLALDRKLGRESLGDFSYEYLVERHRCSGCGYLRFLKERQWAGGSVAPCDDDVGMIADQIASGGSGVQDRAWSQQVVNAAIQSNFTGVRFHRIAVVSSTTGGPIEGLQPYYSVEITGRVTVDRNLYDGGDGFLCPECGVWKPRLEGTVRWGDKMTAIVDDGVDMPDFALAANIAGLSPFVSIRAAQLFGASGFSGFRYMPLFPEYPIGGAGLGDPGAPGWWEDYIEKVRNNLPPGCLL